VSEVIFKKGQYITPKNNKKNLILRVEVDFTEGDIFEGTLTASVVKGTLYQGGEIADDWRTDSYHWEILHGYGSPLWKVMYGD
jgi:hypothetical protein